MIDNPKGPKRGDVTEVVVAKKTDEYVIVETDYKNDGQILASEFTERELKQLKEGNKIRVMAMGFREGMLTFSKIEAEKADQWSMLKITKEKGSRYLLNSKNSVNIYIEIDLFQEKDIGELILALRFSYRKMRFQGNQKENIRTSPD